MNCKITSAQVSENYSDLDSVILPGLTGQVQILPGHAEIFLLLGKGNIILTKDGGQIKTLSVAGGECHVSNDSVNIIL